MDQGTNAGKGRDAAKIRPYSARDIPSQFPTIPAKDPPKFKHAQFPGYVSGVKTTTRGDMQIVITVPSRWLHLATDMYHAHRTPLSIDIQHWDLADE